MNDLQGDQLVVLVLDGTAEVQTGVSVTSKHKEEHVYEAHFIEQALRIGVFSITALSSHVRNERFTFRHRKIINKTKC